MKTKNLSSWKTLLSIVLLVFKTIPVLTIMFNVLGLFTGILAGMTTIVNDFLFNKISDAAAMKDAKILYSPILIYGIFLLVQQIINAFSSFMRSPMLKENRRVMYGKILLKASKIAPESFEDPAFLDDINKAQESVNTLVYIATTFTRIFILSMPVLIINGVYLFRLKPVLLFSLLLAMIPIMIMQVIRTKYFANLEEKSAPLRRECDYYEKIICDREYFKETRLLGAFEFFKSMFSNAIISLNSNIWKTEKKTAIIEISFRIVSTVGYCSIIYLLFILLMNKEISVASFAVVLTSVSTFIQTLENIVSGNFTVISGDLGKAGNLLRFLRMEESVQNDDLKKTTEDIVLNNVSFKYPGNDEYAVKDVSLQIKKGEIIAVVGANGAGKSTLVRLISGIYKPTKGEVILHGINTKHGSNKVLFENVSAIFQKYRRYMMTLSENITISSEKENDIIESLKAADVDITGLPDGLDTMLSREFGGTDLSGGQWQRIAISRGYYRDHNIIFLDEPTAAIDPIEETKIYNKFTDISKGKTTVIVTHRMGSVKIADRIYVLESGSIAEYGTHEELLKANGLYAGMWSSQAQWYN